MSRFNNLEVTVEILDPGVGTSLVANFRRDTENCEPFDLAALGTLPRWKKALSWISYRLRRFL
jgi:hypothetical protein